MRSVALDNSLNLAVVSDFERMEARRRRRRLFTWQSDGRLVPRGPHDASIFPPTGIESDLLPTAPSWTVVRFLEPVRPARRRPAHRVLAMGELGDDGMSSVDVLSFFGDHHKTGILTLSSCAEERSLYLHEGHVCWASSTVPEERLKAHLLAHSELGSAQLDKIRETDDHILGQRVVDEGLLGAVELWAAVRRQVESIVDRIVAMGDGLWTLTSVENEEPFSSSAVRIRVEVVLMEALYRQDERCRSDQPTGRGGQELGAAAVACPFPAREIRNVTRRIQERRSFPAAHSNPSSSIGMLRCTTLVKRASVDAETGGMVIALGRRMANGAFGVAAQTMHRAIGWLMTWHSRRGPTGRKQPVTGRSINPQPDRPEGSAQSS